MKLTIRTKLLFGFLTLMVLLVAGYVVAEYRLDKVKRANAKIREEWTEINLVNQAQLSLDENGARLRLPHGVACSLVLPGGLRKIRDEQLNKFQKIAQALGLAVGNYADENETADAAIAAIDSMIVELGLPKIEEVIGECNGELSELAIASTMEPSMMFSPVLFSEGDIMEILDVQA